MGDTNKWNQKLQEEFEASGEFKEYNRGFNDGYLLSKSDPEFSKLITKRLSANLTAYSLGLQQGRKLHDREKLLEQLKKAKENKARNRGYGRGE